MKKLFEIPKASSDCDSSQDEDERDRIIKELEAEGHQVICVGRGFLTIERCDPEDDNPIENSYASNPLKLSIYGDPDVSGMKEPQFLYIDVGRFGFMDAYLKIANIEGKERVFKLSQELIKDDF